MRLGSLCTGIGAWEKGLQNINKEYDLKFFAEIDKYAIKSYCNIHNEDESKNINDITTADATKLDDIDMLVYSPPCQAFSVAGKMLGVEDKRGVLFFDALKIIEEKRPKIAIMENVKGLTTKKFKETFESMLSELERVGYKNYWKVLNLKNYGLPQNRERVFIVSIRSDIDKGFEFPEGYDNGLRLKDMLEDAVDEKYYISDEKVKSLLEQLNKGKGATQVQTESGLYLHDSKAFSKDLLNGESRCLKASKFDAAVVIPQETNDISFIGNIHNKDFGTGYAGGVWDDNYISPTLTTMQGGGRQPHIIQEPKILNNYRIRKLTPKECWRLQGFDDMDIDRCKIAGISNTQLYKQAGNSIGVTLLEDLFSAIFKIYNI